MTPFSWGASDSLGPPFQGERQLGYVINNKLMLNTKRASLSPQTTTGSLNHAMGRYDAVGRGRAQLRAKVIQHIIADVFP